MTRTLRSLAAAVLLLPAWAAQAQSVDPSGHWTGVIKAPSTEIAVEVDLARNPAGALIGALSMPGEALKGLPLQEVAVDGRSVQFYARTDQRFAGVVSADGTTIAGALIVAEGSAPITLTRAGEARLEAPLRGARIPDELEGDWSATLAGDHGRMHLALSMTNDADGSSTARLQNDDQGGLRLPVRVVVRDRMVTLDSTVFGGSFLGALSEDGVEIAGTYRQGDFTAPLTFRRVPR